MLFKLAGEHPGHLKRCMPTIGFSVEFAQLFDKRIGIYSFDCGTSDKVIGLWRYYLSQVDGLVWVVDGADDYSLEDSRRDLERLLRLAEMKGKPLLVFVNKQDVEG